MPFPLSTLHPPPGVPLVLGWGDDDIDDGSEEGEAPQIREPEHVRAFAHEAALQEIRELGLEHAPTVMPAAALPVEPDMPQLVPAPHQDLAT